LELFPALLLWWKEQFGEGRSRARQPFEAVKGRAPLVAFDEIKEVRERYVNHMPTAADGNTWTLKSLIEIAFGGDADLSQLG
jgi:hypothetical protein